MRVLRPVRSPRHLFLTIAGDLLWFPACAMRDGAALRAVRFVVLSRAFNEGGFAYRASGKFLALAQRFQSAFCWRCQRICVGGFKLRVNLLPAAVSKRRRRGHTAIDRTTAFGGMDRARCARAMRASKSSDAVKRSWPKALLNVQKNLREITSKRLRPNFSNHLNPY